ncbi:MAG: hypothetical protein ABI903_17245 [Actinomycetota bacterium]
MNEPPQRIKAIETRYAGCRFRSRLEARYAVLFDTLGITWQYEPQGFKVGGVNGSPERYYLPDFYLPNPGIWVEVKGSEDALDVELMIDAATPGFGLPRDPDGTPYVDSTRNGPKLLILGPLPDVQNGYCSHWAIWFHKGDYSQNRALLLGGAGLQVDIAPGGRKFACDSGERWHTRHPFTRAVVGQPDTSSSHQLTQAYIAARSARFEHGERGR